MATKKSTLSFDPDNFNINDFDPGSKYSEKSRSTDITDYLERKKLREQKTQQNTQQNTQKEIIEPAEPTRQPEPAEITAEPEPITAKRTSQKQRKASLEEYKNTFLLPPKITDRKTVYLSNETRDRLDEIVRRLGERGSSVSGLIENMANEHLEVYRDEIDQWKRL